MQVIGFSITVFMIQEENEIITLVELRGRAHEAALKTIAKSKTPSNYAFKKNDEILVGRQHLEGGKRIRMANAKEDLSERVREISEEEFEEIRKSAINFFTKLNEEKPHELKKAPLKNVFVKNEKTPEKKERANVKKYFDEHMKKEYSSLEKRSNDEKAERIRRFEERMKEKDKKIQEFKNNSR